ncbi:MAG: hypothetical protein V4676_05160, partial [Bacteroidota bacterium]
MTTISNLYEGFNSVLSLKPLVTVLKKMIAEGKPGARKLYQSVINEVEAIPEILRPIENLSQIKEHELLVETILSTIFPPATSSNQGIYAVSFPFHSETVYASPAFKQLFLKDDNSININDTKTNINIGKANLSLAYNLILKKFYDMPVAVIATSVHPFPDAENGLTKYYELRLNAQFVDVKHINENYTLPDGFSPHRNVEMEEMQELFPLENFRFEGLVVIDVADVTAEQVINEIKNALININAFSDLEVYDEL